MKLRISTLALLCVAAACSDQRSTPLAPRAPDAPRFFATPVTFTLGSGTTGTFGSTDAANLVISCSGPVCPAGPYPFPAFIAQKHPSYALPFAGTNYIDQVVNGPALPPTTPGGTAAVFENVFNLPAGVSSASITILVHADNQAAVAINGTQFGIQPAPSFANFQGAGSSFTTTFTPNPSGTNRLDITLFDVGGAQGLDYKATVTYIPDNTPPVIVPTIAGTPGTNGWYTSDVGLTWTVTDDQSAISSKTGCDASTLTTDSNGATYICTATSAGGTASDTVTLKRDATPPVIAFAGNAGTYTVDQTVNITCSATDATSGIASSTCPDASGPAYSFGAGTQTLSASAVDNAGNNTAASTSFTVQVTSGGLCTLVNQMVSQHGVANSMCQQLANGAFDAFRNHVSAQSGKSLSAADAAILIALSQSL